MNSITEDDLDRLADYTAGTLDPAEAAEVDRLIDTEPAWARAHEALMSAQPRLTEALAGLPRELIPPEIAARLDGAIAGASRSTGTTNVVRFERRRGWTRPALVAAAAVAVVAVGVAGHAALSGGGNSSTSSSAARPALGTAGRNPPALPDDGRIPTTASGTDYSHDTLASAGKLPDARPADGVGQAQVFPDLPDDLARLAGPGALSDCLMAITTVEGGRATSAEFARYQGQPALIVVLDGGSARVVAAGADCGLAGRGAALLDSVS